MLNTTAAMGAMNNNASSNAIRLNQPSGRRREFAMPAKKPD
jgi:hypothetical protein